MWKTLQTYEWFEFLIIFCAAVSVTSFTRIHAVIYTTAMYQSLIGKNQLDILGRECITSGKIDFSNQAKLSGGIFAVPDFWRIWKSARFRPEPEPKSGTALVTMVTLACQVGRCRHWAAVRSSWIQTSTRHIGWEAGMTASETLPATPSTGARETPGLPAQVSYLWTRVGITNFQYVSLLIQHDIRTQWHEYLSLWNSLLSYWAPL